MIPHKTFCSQQQEKVDSYTEFGFHWMRTVFKTDIHFSLDKNATRGAGS
jgi:hypothetical protein